MCENCRATENAGALQPESVFGAQVYATNYDQPAGNTPVAGAMNIAATPVDHFAAMGRAQKRNWREDVGIPHARDIGPFPGVMQIAASAEEHELLNDPLGKSMPPEPLVYHGGRTIVGGRVFHIYLGTMLFDTGTMDAFAKELYEGGYYVSPDGKDVSPSSWMGSITTPYPFGPVVDDASIQQWLEGFLAQRGLHTDQNTLWQVFFPPNTTVSLQGQRSCDRFCGFHNKTARSGIYYAVMCDTSCAGCHGGNTPFEGFTMVTGHEFSEWRSDPDGTAWYGDGPQMRGWENADMCAWQPERYGSQNQWVVQPQAVNGRGCVVGTYKAPGGPPPPPTGKTYEQGVADGKAAERARVAAIVKAYATQDNAALGKLLGDVGVSL